MDAIGAKIKHLQVSLVKLAMENEGVIVPGYTHLQRAQPVLLQHLLLAFVEQVCVWKIYDCLKCCCRSGGNFGFQTSKRKLWA